MNEYRMTCVKQRCHSTVILKFCTSTRVAEQIDKIENQGNSGKAKDGDNEW